MKRSWIGYLLIIACVCFCMASCDEKETSINVDTSQSISSEDNILIESEESSENVSSGTDVNDEDVSSGTDVSDEDVSSGDSGAVSSGNVSFGESSAVSGEEVSSDESESSNVESAESSFNTSEAESTAESSNSTEESSTMESEEESSEDTEGSKTEESSEDISKDTSKDTSKDSSKDTSKDSSKDTSKDTSKENSRDTSKDTSKDISKDTSKDNSKESSQDSSEEPSSEESSVEVSSAVHTHNYKSVVYEPWCGIEGYTEHTCECGDVYTDNYVAALEHTYGDWKVIEEPSTIADGKKRRVCKVCTKFQYEAIPKIVVTITKEDLDMMASAALEMLNEQRVAKGLQPLVTGPIAHQMASERAEQLTVHFSHLYPGGNGGTRYEYKKYQYNVENSEDNYMPFASGENIAKSLTSTGGIIQNRANFLRVTGRGLMGGFQLSSGHWSDLMSDKYTACGIGVYVSEIGDNSMVAYICVMTMDKLYGTDAE